MSAGGVAIILLLALPALAFVLWPFLRRGQAPAGLLPIPQDRRGELDEEKTSLYRALRELEFDYQAGHLSADDYAGLRARYESRAAQILKELDGLPPPRRPSERRQPAPESAAGVRRPWTWSPVALSAAAVVLVAFGVTLGVGVARFTEPDRTMVPPGSRIPVTVELPPTPASEPARPIPPEMLQGMLQAAHQSLDAARYREAIAAYQAVLKRDPRNVEAITHLGVILSIAGHTDDALAALDKAITIDPRYAHAYLDKGRVLYEGKRDYQGAIEAWEQFLSLAPSGEDRERASRFIQEAKRRLVNAEP